LVDFLSWWCGVVGLWNFPLPRVGTRGWFFWLCSVTEHTQGERNVRQYATKSEKFFYVPGCMLRSSTEQHSTWVIFLAVWLSMPQGRFSVPRRLHGLWSSHKLEFICVHLQSLHWTTDCPISTFCPSRCHVVYLRPLTCIARTRYMQLLRDHLH
jgi:hypothetical protein